MAKATHTGTCQVCGRTQKLPGDLLAKHGYTKQWGFFTGTCWGSDELPFEISITLIERAIREAVAARQQLSDEADRLLADTNPAKVWVHPYKKIKGDLRGRKAHQWEKVSINNISEDGRYFTDADGEQHQSAVYSVWGVDDKRTAVAVALNERRANAIQREAQHYADYIAWQQQRIKDWVSNPDARKPVAA